MSKEAYYFPHDSNAQQDEKILALRMKFGWEGYGIYWALIEILRDASDYQLSKDYNRIAFQLRTDASKIKSIVEDFGLFAFTDESECIYSESLNRRMQVKETKKRELSLQGIIGNLIKNKHLTKDQINKMTAEQIIEFNENIKTIRGRPPGDQGATAIKEKEIKENKKKVKENSDDFRYLGNEDSENSELIFVKNLEDVSRQLKSIKSINQPERLIKKLYLLRDGPTYEKTNLPKSQKIAGEVSDEDIAKCFEMISDKEWKHKWENYLLALDFIRHPYLQNINFQNGINHDTNEIEHKDWKEL